VNLLSVFSSIASLNTGLGSDTPIVRRG